MLLLFWLVLLLVGACIILLMPALWGKQIYNSYHDPRTVNCPETHAPVSVRFDALRAAITGITGPPKLRLVDCSRWPERADCGQECIPDAAQSKPAQVSPIAPPAQPRVFHLPVLVAAAAAWVLGMVWHSEYLFRPQWMAALNLSDRQTRDLAEMWAPHLLTVGACLLFAYGVAWIMSWLRDRSLFLGIRVAVSFWLLMVAILLAVTRVTIPNDLLWIEGIYTFLAALLIGAIVGGVPRRIFLKD
jgi:uncharacterized protein DUF1761